MFVRIAVVRFCDDNQPFRFLPSCSRFYVGASTVAAPFIVFLNNSDIYRETCLHCHCVLAFLQSERLDAVITSFGSPEYIDCKKQQYSGSVAIHNPLPFKGYVANNRWAAIYDGFAPSWALVRIDPVSLLPDCLGCDRSRPSAPTVELPRRELMKNCMHT